MSQRAFRFSLFLILVLSHLTSTSWAQQRDRSSTLGKRLGEITGRLRLADGSAIAQIISVRLEGQASGVVREVQTDTSGRFKFTGLTLDTYTVAVVTPGYERAYQQVILQGIPMANVELELRPSPDTDAKQSGIPPEGAAAKVSAAEIKVPKEARKYYEKGEDLLTNRHDPRASIEKFERAIKVYPAYAAAHFSLGLAYMQLRDWNAAELSLERAIQIDQNFAPAYLALGAAFNEQKKYADAETPLVRTLALDPKSAMGHYEFARQRAAVGRWAEAEEHVTTALTLEPNLPEAHVLMGNLMLRKRDPRTAVHHYQEYLRLNPAGPMAVAVRGAVTRIQKDMMATAQGSERQ